VGSRRRAGQQPGTGDHMTAVAMTPLERLRERVERLGPLCLGVDPNPDALPEHLTRDVHGIETFARGLLEAAAPSAAAIKINVAFFEAFGSAGWAALERVRADVPPDHVLILDAKRGDIGSTAERYAEALFGRLAADAVTVSPYLGEDAILPFLAHPDRMVYVLARTSNPSAGTLQDLPVRTGAEELPLHHAVARWVAERWPEARVGLVVGATAPGELRALRRIVPEPGFLVPGIGPQGGDPATAAKACHGTRAPGLVNVTRGISGAATGSDWRTAAAGEAERWRGLLSGSGATLSS
ncbi:MAG TPA: orotidine-5'-phosphate decarboxylase, partial [Candidatus Limnocylindria bacterium]|nr:orotidine-5'-phosphate decarboxylase [Candidatus Limnocylindria bacterium]